MRKATTYTYNSIFAEEFNGFLQDRAAKGSKESGERYILKCLDDHLTQKNISEKILERDVIDSFLNSIDSSISKKSRYTSVYRLLSTYLRNLGYEAYQPPALRATQAPAPRILSHEEMDRLFYACDNLSVINDHSNVQLWFPVVIRLIYGCGLRVGEAVGLLNKDIDWANGTLSIRSGISNRNRLLPMSDSLIEICRKYYESAHPTPLPDAHFFYNNKGKAHTSAAPYFWFQKALDAAGIDNPQHEGHTKSVSLNMLRQTFAVHSLQHQAAQGVDPISFLPILSAYLGHADMSETEFYLKFISE